MPTIACPYCNAPVPVPVPPPVGSVPCPRCGEGVRMRSPAEGRGDSTTPTITPEPSISENIPRPDPRSANRSVARMVLAFMLFMAAVSLVYALWTIDQRRANDFKGEVANNVKGDEKDPVLPVERPIPPAEWAGLGYLPDDVQAVAGVQLAAPEVRALLAPLGMTGGEAGRGGVLGLAADEVDHAIFAANLRTLPPRVITVVRTKSPLSAERVRTAIPAARSAERNGKALTLGRLWAGGLEGAAWQPDAHTLVIAQLPEDIDKLPATPRPGVSRFAPPLQGLLTRRVNPVSLAWLAAYSEPDNAALGLVSSLLPLPPAERDAWTRLEALAVSVGLHFNTLAPEWTTLSLTTELHGRDAATSEALADGVAKSLAAAGVTPKRSADGDWRRLEATTDTAKLAAWVRSLRGQNQP